MKWSLTSAASVLAFSMLLFGCGRTSPRPTPSDARGLERYLTGEFVAVRAEAERQGLRAASTWLDDPEVSEKIFDASERAATTKEHDYRVPPPRLAFSGPREAVVFMPTKHDKGHPEGAVYRLSFTEDHGWVASTDHMPGREIRVSVSPVSITLSPFFPSPVENPVGLTFYRVGPPPK